MSIFDITIEYIIIENNNSNKYNSIISQSTSEIALSYLISAAGSS